MVETREVMDVREASQYLGVSRETLYKYVYEDRIPAFKLGNRWKFKKTVLDRWMEKQSTRYEERTERKGRAAAR
jgi:excisionase family DNA binding protein